MQTKPLTILVAGLTVFAASVLPASALHKKIRVPIVSSVEVHDQSSQVETYNTIPYTDYHMGLTSPSKLLATDGTEYGYYKKVEIIFHMAHVVNGDHFTGKQQLKGTDSSTQDPNDPNIDHNYPDWAVDGPTAFVYGSFTIDNLKVVTMEDCPGWGSSTINYPGGSITDEDIKDMHFRDKIRWYGPDGSLYDVYGASDPDPYFGYWARYVDLKTSPNPPPSGTNGFYLVASGGNY